MPDAIAFVVLTLVAIVAALAAAGGIAEGDVLRAVAGFAVFLPAWEGRRRFA